MTTEPEMRCATCLFWNNEVPPIASSVKRPRGADPLVGTCHARPPEAARSAAFMIPLFPETHADRFCGSWQPDGEAGPDGGERQPLGGTVIPVDFRGAA